MTRQPYITWQVGEEEYKLKLTTAAICKIEEKTKINLIKLFVGTELPLPPLKILLLLVHGSMQKFNKGMSFEKVLDVYDSYIDEGNDQTALLTDIIFPLLEHSGLIPKNTEGKTELMTLEELEDQN